MPHPRAALVARHPLKGTMPAARQSRFHGIPGLVQLSSESGLFTQGTAEPALPGRQCHPLGGDAEGGAGGARPI